MMGCSGTYSGAGSGIDGWDCSLRRTWL